MIRPGFTTATHSSGLPLPLPIRVSAGFFVTGLSGKIRIHILPPRLRLRVSATRPASTCRLVAQPGSSAFSPYSPNASVAPRCAVPRIRPRWAFRYLTRLGISTRGVLSRFRRRGAQHFALEDPDLHADRSVCRVGGRESVVDVCANRVQRHAAVAVPLLACDLAATQPPRTRDPDAVGAQAQCGGDRLLHGAAKRHALLELERHVLGHKLGVELGVDDLLDVEVDLLARPRLQLVLQLLHLGPLPADDDARPGRGDRDPRPVRRALDVDLGDARVIELILDVAPDLHILMQQICVALRREPAGAPRPRRTEAEADRMRLLAHLYVFSLDLEPLDVDPFDLAPFGFAALFGAALGVGRAAARPFLAAGGRGACTSAGAGAGGALSRGVGTGRTAPLVSSLTPIVRWLDRCRMEKGRPIARGCTRFIEGPPSATASTTRRSSRLRSWWLCSALATAERSTFSTSRAAARGVYSSVASASPTGLPRIWSSTSRAFRADTRTNRALAVVFIGSPHPSRYDFPVGEVVAFSAAPCALNVRVSANSPRRWPTTSSVTYTGMNFLPLWTASV